MAEDSSAVRVALSGSFRSAPLGSTAPIGISGAWGTAFYDHGYTTPDGVDITPSVTKVDAKAWQSRTPVRSWVSERAYQIKVILIQSGAHNFELAFGGGSWAAVTGETGTFKFTPPAPGAVDQRMIGIEWIDGTIVTRWVFNKAIVTSVGAIKGSAGQETRLEVTLDVNDQDWVILSNDPAVDPSGGGGIGGGVGGGPGDEAVAGATGNGGNGGRRATQAA